MTSERNVLAFISLFCVSSLSSDGNLNTVDPRYNEGQGDWQNILAITRFRLSRFYFTILLLLG